MLYAISFLFFAYKRIMVLMHFFQQEEYHNKRFILYILKNSNLIDKKLSVCLAICMLITLISNNLILHLSLLSAILVSFAIFQYNPIKNAKKALVITSRVKRLFEVIMLILTIILAFIFFNKNEEPCFLYMLSILLVQAMPLIIIITNILLFPAEKIIQFKYLTQAKAKLTRYNPTVIAITGSYGKTSTKHILAHILGSVAPTLATPGSINTPMGITRIIREQLLPEHKFFIVEMGAYGKGSIARLCNLTPPNFGIITSIGNAHFERFKSIENVAKAKFELAQAVMKNKQGLMFINANAVAEIFINKYCSTSPIMVTNKTKNIPETFNITNTSQTVDGIKFQIQHDNSSYNVNSNLYGLHHVENIALCFALAHKLGISAETITASLRITPQIRHRLEVIKEKSKPVIIDDAYNSNPTGFTAALGVLQTFKEQGYRSIIVTPGMVELGKLHNDKHFEIGEKTSKIADYVLVITPKRIPSFIDGFNSKANNKQKLITFDTFEQAKQWLDQNTTYKDIVLFENDLPDLYDSKVNL
jgi:UDP-N-acetylmuramoyl-tripeptide--D-alanyl-D-alanine ligase